MLALIQRTLTLGAAILVIAATVWVCRTTCGPTALLPLVGLIAIYVLVLGLEYVLVARANRADPAPRASLSQLLSAGLGEALFAPKVFCWRQPFRSNRWPDQFGSGRGGARGVVLIHGYLCNRGLWNRWMARLTGDGVPFIAVNLEPVFGSIDAYRLTIEAAIAKLEASTGLPPIVVAHSMGGLALRQWWALPGNFDRVHHAITLGTPHHGTWLARLAFSTNARQMRHGSPWLTTLANSEPKELGRRITAFYSHCDNIVYPASTATFPGAANRHLAATAHVHMVDHPSGYEALEALLSL